MFFEREYLDVFHPLVRQVACHIPVEYVTIDGRKTQCGTSHKCGRSTHWRPQRENDTVQPAERGRFAPRSFMQEQSMSLLSRRASAPQQQAPGSGYSLLDSQLTVDGDIDTQGSLRIDGRLNGSIRRADTVVLGAGASMNGDVYAREVIVGGTLTGDVYATERVELQPTAIVTGDITAQVVLVQEGGVVNGRVQMQSPGELDITSSHGGELSIPQGRN
jgi:cytoskeletal protein CcmA (bactofilin family)